VDKHGTVLYVGKAKDLKARVRTYFNGGDGRRKIGRLVEEVAEVCVRETESELHALILEGREIKRLLPRYNSAGRDDKASWFIRLDTSEPYPVPERVSTNASEEGVVHLGPYRSAGVLDTCIEALGRIFPLKRCSGEGGICFYGQMGRCAPCVGMDEREYRSEVVDEVVALLRGEGGAEHLRALVRERERLARGLEFEAAARLRDLISGIERVRLARAVVSAEGVQAVVAPSTEPGVIEVFVLLGGRLVAHRGFEAADTAGLAASPRRCSPGRRSRVPRPARKALTRRGSSRLISGAVPPWSRRSDCGGARPRGGGGADLGGRPKKRPAPLA
jgi:excinuclease UvrABC nuclease subunit